MDSRIKRIKKYGRDIVEHDEKVWRERGYTINKTTGLLELTK